MQLDRQSARRLPAVAILVTAFVAAVAENQPAAGDDAVLRWRFAPGEQLEVTVWQDLRQQGQVASPTLENPVELSVRLAAAIRAQWLVQEVDDDGAATIAASIQRIRATVAMPDGAALDFDSGGADPPAEEAAALAASVRPLVGLKWVQRLSPRGQVLAIEWPAEEASATPAPRPAGGLPGAPLLSAEGLRHLFGHLGTALPEGPVEVGGAWSDSVSLTTPLGVVRGDKAYTYRGPAEVDGRQLEQIDVRLTLALPETPVSVRLGGETKEMQVRIVEQSGQGSSAFDAAAGRLTAAEMRQRLKLEARLGEMQMTQTAEIVSRLQIAPAAPQP